MRARTNKTFKCTLPTLGFPVDIGKLGLRNGYVELLSYGWWPWARWLITCLFSSLYFPCIPVKIRTVCMSVLAAVMKLLQFKKQMKTVGAYVFQINRSDNSKKKMESDTCISIKVTV